MRHKKRIRPPREAFSGAGYGIGLGGGAGVREGGGMARPARVMNDVYCPRQFVPRQFVTKGFAPMVTRCRSLPAMRRM
jgi:hypothetical protein